MRGFGPGAARREIEAGGWGLRVERIARAGEGEYSVAFTVNGDLVFRFAKHEEAAAGLRREICLLPRLRPALDVAIPEFSFTGQRENGLPFVGYRKIVGTALGPALYWRLREERRRRVLEQLAAFFTALHAFPIAEALACGVPLVDARADAEADLARFRAMLFPRLDGASRSHAERCYSDYLGDPENFAYTPVLLHGDVSPEHLLYDRRRGEIAGIIDFGDLQIGDPDYDLMYVYEDWGEPFVRTLLAHYRHSEPDRLFEKLRFWYERNNLRDLADALDLPGAEKADTSIPRNSLEGDVRIPDH